MGRDKNLWPFNRKAEILRRLLLLRIALISSAPLFSKEGRGEISTNPNNPPHSPFRKGGSFKYIRKVGLNRMEGSAVDEVFALLIRDVGFELVVIGDDHAAGHDDLEGVLDLHVKIDDILFRHYREVARGRVWGGRHKNAY